MLPDRFPFSAIVLIGMSGVGKTHWAAAYGEKTTWDEARQKIRESGTFLCTSADDHIERLLDRDLREMEKNRDKSRVAPVDLPEAPIDRLAEYVGKFGGEKFGGFPLLKFFERQERYKLAERESLRALSVLLDGDSVEQSLSQAAILYDTTGSFCEVVKKGDGFYQEIVERHAVIVYLECSEDDEKILLQRQKKRPKPMVYNKEFFESFLRFYKKMANLDDKDIRPDDFLEIIFPKLIEYRRARYAELAHVTLTTAELERLTPPAVPSMTGFPKRFLSLVKDKLASSRTGRGLELA